MYHSSNLGSYAHSVGRDMEGYIPEADDGPWDLTYDHGAERTHDNYGALTEYGQWWEEERWPELLNEAVAATAEAEMVLKEWRQNA